MQDIFKVIIVDDEPYAIKALKECFSNYPRFKIEGTACSGTAGIKIIQEIQPDLLFLDVELPDMYGMELLSNLKDEISWSMRVVFYTAHNKYMINALRNYAFDFLLKPVDNREFDVVISRFILDNEKGINIPDCKNIQISNIDIPFMLITPTGDLRIVKKSDIGYFKYISSRKTWDAILITGECLMLKRNTSAELLCSFDDSFVRVHQSYIINMNYLLMLQDSRCIMCPPFENCTEITVSRKYKKEIMERFCIF